MTPVANLFLIIETLLLFVLPRRWAVLPLLVGACYTPSGQGIEIGPFHFTFIRLVIAAGFIRVFIRKEWLLKGLNRLDWLIITAAAWTVFSSWFHKDPTAALVFRLGLVYNSCGAYFLLRIFCRNLDDAIHLVKVAAILLAPVAIEMIFEKLTAFNYYSLLGGVDKSPNIRDGIIRANGPFAHAILAGTVGAVCLPLLVGIWRKHKTYAVLGILACLTMVITSASSGPLLSASAAVMALFLWYLRKRMQLVRWLAVLGYIALDLVMKSPAYYLIARIDLAGGSTGWHRSRLIESAIDHLSEWWFAGTDYTRHWMPTGVSWSPEHADITNHYIQMGVIGGLPLMFLFIATLAVGFLRVGQELKKNKDHSFENQFFIWCLGSSLFAHAVTCLAVSYFDQSFMFLYLTIALIGSIRLK